MSVVSRRWMWVESMSGASGCGCKGYIDFLILLIPTLLFLYLFFFAAASLPLFILKMFFIIYTMQWLATPSFILSTV